MTLRLLTCVILEGLLRMAIRSFVERGTHSTAGADGGPSGALSGEHCKGQVHRWSSDKARLPVRLGNALNLPDRRETRKVRRIDRCRRADRQLLGVTDISV